MYDADANGADDVYDADANGAGVTVSLMMTMMLTRMVLMLTLMVLIKKLTCGSEEAARVDRGRGGRARCTAR